MNFVLWFSFKGVWDNVYLGFEVVFISVEFCCVAREVSFVSFCVSKR